MSLLGIDVGTTGVKAVVFNLEGKIIASSYKEYPLIYIKQGWIELNPHIVWNSIEEVIKKVNILSKKDPVEVVSVSSMGESFVSVDSNGNILGNSIANLDTRAEFLMEGWEEKLGRFNIFKITGQSLNPVLTVNKLIWLKKFNPQLFKKVWKFLCYEDFVFYKLGGMTITDYSIAARTMAFDISKKKWSDKILNIAGLDENLLPNIKPSGEIIGEVSEKVAKQLGFKKKVLLVSGAHDQPAGALGSGIIKEEIAMDSTGTVECITPTFNKLNLNKKMLEYNYCCSPAALKGLYVTFAYNFTGGSLLRWYRDILANEEKRLAKKLNKDVYDLILENLPKSPTNLFILPHFLQAGTPYFDSNSKGVILGLTIGTKKNEIVKAILEGITYEMKLNLYCLEKAGIKINEIRAIGGGAKSDVWLKLKADMFNKKVVSLNVSESACLGVALLGGVAIGKYKSIFEAINNVVKVKKVFYPDSQRSKIYEEKFKVYKKIYPTLKDILHKI
ncbi:MAG: FGGY-family carbohydrate kinase [Candidatus Firestonebacteria bacterium]